jgi:hypothetical protein
MAMTDFPDNALHTTLLTFMAGLSLASPAVSGCETPIERVADA